MKTPDAVHDANVAGLDAVAASDAAKAKRAQAERARAANNEPSLDELAQRLWALTGNAQLELHDAATVGWSWEQRRALDAAMSRNKPEGV